MADKLSNESLNRISVEQFKNSTKMPVIVVLDNVRSLNNVGSVFRTADAFLIEEVLLCGLTGLPPNKEIEKTALGATLSVNWRHFDKTLLAVNWLKNNNYQVYAVEQVKQSVKLNKMTYTGEKIALIFGNEVYGVEQEVIDACQQVIEIPQAGTKHSLNISVSVGVVLWQLLKDNLENRF